MTDDQLVSEDDVLQWSDDDDDDGKDFDIDDMDGDDNHQKQVIRD